MPLRTVFRVSLYQSSRLYLVPRLSISLLTMQTACVKQTPQVAPRLALPMTEHDLREADQAEHAFRSVGRLLCAGQPFAFLASPKKECLKDFQILLGQFYDMSRFPVRGGRLVIAGEQRLQAGFAPFSLLPEPLPSFVITLLHNQYCYCALADVLTRMLGIPVSLVDIKRWFPTPDSQKMTVHQELSGLLSCRGMTWPPQADCFWQCSRYRCVQLSSKFGTASGACHNIASWTH